MKSISKIGIHNIFRSNETAFIDVDSPITILTGYNGTGKSTTLSVVHSTVSLANNGEYLSPRSDWASQIFLSDGRILNHAKIRSPNTETTIPEIKNPAKAESLKIYFNALTSTHTGHFKKSKTIVSKEGEKRDSRSTNFFEITPRKATSNREIGLQTLLYCDELFHFKSDIDHSDKLEDLDIFSKKNTLDKTLYLLIIEFAALESKSDFNKDLQEFIKQIDTLIAKSILPATLRDKVDHLKAVTATHSTLLKEANLFFKMTNRELFFSENKKLKLRLMSNPSDEIEWYNLSKGEKTLLCLLLAAFMQKDNNTVFLLDEPDLSLHIKWQKQLLKSLRNLAPNCQFIISTHSPAMIGNAEGEKIVNIGALTRT